MRETLIRIIREVQYLGGLEEKVADHLIANGVTIPVRCKGCKYFDCDYCSHDKMEHSRCREDDFCSYGERRTDG